MEKQEILKEIADGLGCLITESPQTLRLALDYYIDTYYEDSISALILKWDQLGYGDFGDIFPTTTKLIAKLELINDWIERPRKVYEDIISLAEDALGEIYKFMDKLG